MSKPFAKKIDSKESANFYEVRVKVFAPYTHRRSIGSKFALMSIEHLFQVCLQYQLDGKNTKNTPEKLITKNVDLMLSVFKFSSLFRDNYGLHGSESVHQYNQNF